MSGIAKAAFVKAGRALATSATNQPSTAVILGDSITALNSTGVNGDYSDRGYFHWANALSGNRLTLLNNAGIPSDTTLMMLDRMKADVLDYHPGWVVILAGHIDLTAGERTAAETFATLETIIARVHDAGARAIVSTLTPSSAYSPAAKTQRALYNDRIRGLTSRGVVVVDMGSAWADPVTGEPLPGYVPDMTHPNANAAILMGEALAEALTVVTPPRAVFPLSDSDGNLLANGSLSGSGGTVDGSASGVAPDNWTLAGSAVSTGAKTPRSDLAGRDWLEVAIESAGEVQLGQQINAGVSEGDEVEFVCEVDGSDLSGVVSITPRLEFRLPSFELVDTRYALKDSGVAVGRAFGHSVFRTPPWVVPPGVTRLQARVMLIAGGGAVRIGRAYVLKKN